ncbi:hypothetical protein DNTS_008452 [Danionella cerebrum]|uniref:Uncharacterized protein n=1 Tax=Danionella cerebrum TaxID=2873325 RepID=A0A553QX61_9TELE|nr:hypothetical protein DNTS_008452 [Danionella translucida]
MNAASSSALSYKETQRGGVSWRTSLATPEECPYCGKPFKRLKTHMPHCKKAPGSQPKKTNHMSKELSKSPSRSKTLEDNNNEKLPIKSKMTGDLSSGATDQVSPSETLEMKTPKSNGLSKGQKEFERLQLVPVSQNSTKTSVKLSTKPDHVTSKHHTPKMPLSEGLSKTSIIDLQKTSVVQDKEELVHLFQSLLLTATEYNSPQLAVLLKEVQRKNWRDNNVVGGMLCPILRMELTTSKERSLMEVPLSTFVTFLWEEPF